MSPGTAAKATIFQFWDESPPSAVSQLMDTWQNAGPMFDYKFFDQAAASEFVSSNFDARTSAAFARCAVPAMKADFFRYCALLVHGGVYADADIERVGDIAQLFNSCHRGVLFTRQTRIANDFMIMRAPADPLMRHVLNQAILNIESRASNSVWQVTGPGIMTKIYKENYCEFVDLFRDIDILAISRIRRYVQFHWSLEYKKEESHWTIAEKARSIFCD
jgi:mannosyltransferase OCH1-like enzyme